MTETSVSGRQRIAQSWPELFSATVDEKLQVAGSELFNKFER